MTREELLNQELQQLKKKVRQLETQLVLSKNASAIQNIIETHCSVSITDASGVIIYVNNRFCQQYGYSQAELLGATHQIIRSGQHSPDFYRHLWQTISGGESWHGVIKNQARDSSYYWVDMTITPVMAADGQICRYIAISNDLTGYYNSQIQVQELLEESRDTNEEMKASEEELRQTLEHVIEVNDKIRESEEKYRLISESMSDLVCLLNLDGNYTYVSQSVHQLLGYLPEEMIQKRAHWLVHPDEQELATTFLSSAFRDQIRQPYIQLRKRHRDGHYIWFEMIAKPILDAGGQVVSVHTTCRNVAARKKAEQERDNFFNHSLDLMAIARLDGEILRFNHSWQEALGFREEEVQGKSFFDFLHPGDLENTRRFFREETGSGRTVLQTESAYRCKNNSYKWLSWNFIVFADEGVMYGFARDITERKIAEEALKNALEELKQRNVELDHYVYKVSHDLRSPLCSIKGLLSLSYDEPDLKTVLLYNRMIEERITRSDEFIMSILNHSKMLNSGLNISLIDFNKILTKGFEDQQYVQHFNRIHRQVEISQKTPFYGDAFRISVILRNFISNAVKFQNLSSPESFVRFKIEADGNMALIVITDNGIGIEQEHLPKIFEMFYRATEKAEGSGLGLYIVKQAIDRIGGLISINSRPGQGTEIVVSLPNMPPAG